MWNLQANRNVQEHLQTRIHIQTLPREQEPAWIRQEQDQNKQQSAQGREGHKGEKKKIPKLWTKPWISFWCHAGTCWRVYPSEQNISRVTEEEWQMARAGGYHSLILQETSGLKLPRYQMIGKWEKWQQAFGSLVGRMITCFFRRDSRGMQESTD